MSLPERKAVERKEGAVGMIIMVEEKKWAGYEYRLTGNVIYVNADRIVYAEYQK